MYVNRTYRSMVDQYSISKGRGGTTSHRTHLKVDRRSTYVSQSILDQMEDDRLTGGYDVNDVCESCWTTRSVNGVCGCL